MTRTALVAMTAVIVAACTVSDATPPGQSTATTTTTTSSSTTTTTTMRDCSGDPRPPTEPMAATDPAGLSVMLSRLTFECAHEAVVTATDAAAIEAGVAVATAHGIPVLVRGDGVEEELARLGVSSIRWVGPAPAPDLGVVSEVVDPSSVMPAEADPVTDGGAVWVFDGDPAAATLVAHAARARGAGFVDVGSIEDLRTAEPAVLESLRAREVVAVGLDAHRAWQLAAARHSPELPGGGLTFDGTRLVAFYGNPSTPFLGVLGEQGPAATLERLAPLVEDYSVDGLRGVPTFEIIATVASSRAGDDGDYSDEAGTDLLRPWVDFAAENGVYVILDLQPGRTDFLTQAKRYEEFLRLPNVGLALDPEWRLEPDQVHLRQIGSVDASEVNDVSRWLAGIVREERLAQKYFVVHQFRFSMITNRETIETPPELYTVIQMDGQGPLHTKYETFSAITAGQADVGWQWGWKNFYDEDSPMATPGEVLALDPTVVYVSFQ